MGHRKPGYLFRRVASLALLCALIFLTRGVWLPWAGQILVHDDGPARAQAALVLGGDYYGHRIERAAELARSGYVPLVLVSGPSGFYGLHESDMAIPFAVRRGFPASWFAALPHDARSTREEAQDILPEMRRRGIHSFLLVTSDYHTARARRTFLAVAKQLGMTIEMRTVAAPDEFFRAESWWKDREAQKTVFFEYSKTIASALGR